MKKNNFSFIILFTIVIINTLFFFSCETNSIKKNEENKKFSSVMTESKILKGYGINNYSIYSTDANNLYIQYDKEIKNNNIIYSTNSDLRTHTFSFSNTNLSFTLIFNEREKSFTLKSSKGDNIAAIIQGQSFVDKVTKEKINPLWFTKLNFDYILMIKMMEIVQEIQVKKYFISSITLMDEKINKEIMTKKALNLISGINGFNSGNKIMVAHPCSSGYSVCNGEMKFATTQTIACSESLQTLGSACSNQYCIGYCENLGCDCICGFFDYACFCTSKGRYCTGPDISAF